jgi:hypothetical protein
VRRPTARVPFLVMVAGAVSAAVLVSEFDVSRDAPASTRRERSPVSALMPLAPPADASATTFYCAAGTGVPDGMADHTVVVVNTGDVPVAARVTLYGGDLVGAPVDAAGDDVSDGAAPDGGAPGIGVGPTGGELAPVHDLIVLPAGRAAVRLGDLLEAPFVAAVVEVEGGPAVVEHEVAGPHGRDAGPCATRAGTDWHLAWGATTREAREVVVVFNPFPSHASIDAVFRVEGGGREPVRFQGVPVPAGRVVALDVGAEVRREHHVAATIRTRRGHVIAERLQSFDGTDGPAGLAVALASPEPATTWAFAAGEVSEAAAPIVAVYNPGEERAEVEVAVLPDGWADGGAPPDGGAGGTGDEIDETASDDPEADDPGGEDPAGDESEGDESEGDESEGDESEGDDSDGEGVDSTPGAAPPPFGLSIGPGDHRIVRLGDEARVPSGVGLAIVVSSRNGVPVVAERVVRTDGVPDGAADEDGDGADAVDAADGGGADGDGEDGDGDAAPPGLAAGPGAPVASSTWWFGGLVTVGAPPPAVSVLNLDTTQAARVSLRAITPEAIIGSTVADVPPGGRMTIDLGTGPLVRDTVLVLASDVPVVAERLVTSGGTAQALAPGVAAVDEAVPLTPPTTEPSR